MSFSILVKKDGKYKVAISFDEVIGEVFSQTWLETSGDYYLAPRSAKSSDLYCGVAEVDKKDYIRALCAIFFHYRHRKTDWGKYKPKRPGEHKDPLEVTSTYPCKLTVREILFKAYRLLIYLLHFLVEEDTIILRNDEYWDYEKRLKELEEEVKREPAKLKDEEYADYFESIKKDYDFYRECVKKYSQLYEERGTPITANDLDKELMKVREALKAKGIKVDHARITYELIWLK